MPAPSAGGSTRRIRIIIDSSDAARGARRINRNLDSIREHARRVERAVIGMAATFGSVLAGDLLNSFVEIGSKLQDLTGRLKESESAVGNQADVMKVLFGTAKETYTELDTVVELYSRLRAATEDYNTGQQDVVRITKTVANTLRLWGTSAEEASSVMLQFSQAMGSGKLANDELRSVLEGNRVLAKIFAQEFGVSVADLRKLGADGELVVERLIKAILNAEADISARSANLGVPISRAVENLNTSVKELVARALPALDMLSSAVLWLSRNLKDVLKAVGLVAGAFAGLAVAKGIDLLIAGLIKLRAIMLAVGAAGGIMTVGVAALPAIIGAAAVAILYAWDDLNDMVRQWDTIWEIIKVKTKRYAKEIEIFLRETVQSWSKTLSEFFATPIDPSSVLSVQVKPGGYVDQFLGLFDGLGDEIKKVAAPELVEGVTGAYGVAAEAVKDVSASLFMNPLSIGAAGALSASAEAQTGPIKALKEEAKQLAYAEDELQVKLREATSAGKEQESLWDKLTKGLTGSAEKSDKVADKQKKVAAAAKKTDDNLKSLLNTLYPIQAALQEYNSNLEMLTSAAERGAISAAMYVDAQARLKEQLMETFNPMQQRLEDLRFEQELIGKTAIEVDVLRAEYEGAKQAADLFAAGQAAMGYAVLDTTAKIKEQLLINDELEQRNLAIQQSAQSLAQSVTDAWSRMIEGGGSFKDVLKSVQSQIIQLANKALIMKPLEDLFTKWITSASSGSTGGGFGAVIGQIFAGAAASSNGNVISPSGVAAVPSPVSVQRFAMGGVVDKESFFAVPGNRRFLGSLAEGNRPEAIMPLKRDRSGRLGVVAEGGHGGNTVNVSVNVTGVQDANSFRKAAGQIEADMASALTRASQRLN